MRGSLSGKFLYSYRLSGGASRFSSIVIRDRVREASSPAAAPRRASSGQCAVGWHPPRILTHKYIVLTTMLQTVYANGTRSAETQSDTNQCEYQFYSLLAQPLTSGLCRLHSGASLEPGACTLDAQATRACAAHILRYGCTHTLSGIHKSERPTTAQLRADAHGGMQPAHAGAPQLLPSSRPLSHPSPPR
jgi:hypothetical protein